MLIIFFFFNDTATTEIYTLSLHDALPISSGLPCFQIASRMIPKPTASSGFAQTVKAYLPPASRTRKASATARTPSRSGRNRRSEEHTSELQSRLHLVCRLLLEKKKKIHKS